MLYGVWDDLVPWLLTDNGVGGVNTLLSGHIYRRFAPANSPKPFAVVKGPHDYNTGVTASGVLKLKLAQFKIVIASGKLVSTIAPVASRINALMEPIRGMQIGNSWVQAFMLDDMQEVEVEDPAKGEDTLPGIVLCYIAGYSSRPVS